MALDLIYDRTQADVLTLEKLTKLLDRVTWYGLTEEQKEQWENAQKGCYNASDLNRVERAVAYLTEQFNSLPGTLAAYLSSLGVAPDSIFAVPYSYPIQLTMKTDWAITDIPSSAAMARYIYNVTALRNTITLPENTPPLPVSMNDLTVTGANNLERVLQIVDAATLALEELKKSYADKAALSFVYSGEFSSGEV